MAKRILTLAITGVLALALQPASAQIKRNSPTRTALDDQYSDGLSLSLTSATSKAVGSKAPPIHAL